MPALVANAVRALASQHDVVKVALRSVVFGTREAVQRQMKSMLPSPTESASQLPAAAAIRVVDAALLAAAAAGNAAAVHVLVAAVPAAWGASPAARNAALRAAARGDHATVVDILLCSRLHAPLSRAPPKLR